jgi:hypothetical protein
MTIKQQARRMTARGHKKVVLVCDIQQRVASNGILVHVGWFTYVSAKTGKRSVINIWKSNLVDDHNYYVSNKITMPMNNGPYVKIPAYTFV